MTVPRLATPRALFLCPYLRERRLRVRHRPGSSSAQLVVRAVADQRRADRLSGESPTFRGAFRRGRHVDVFSVRQHRAVRRPGLRSPRLTRRHR